MYGLVLITFIIIFFAFWRKPITYKIARKRFYLGVTSVFENCSDDSECIPQIQMLYKRLSERYSSLSENIRSSTEMIEDLICSIDTSNQEQFKEKFGIERPLQIRSRIINTLNLMKNLQPFSSLSSKEGNLLNMLKHAIDTQNPDLAKNTLSQLADEIEVLEGSLRAQSKRNQVSFVISIVGVILTVFFGIIAFIQFVAKAK